MIESKQLNHTEGRGRVFWYLDYAAVKVRKRLYVTTTKTETSILVEKFVEDHYDEVFRYYARRLPSKEDAQDAT